MSQHHTPHALADALQQHGLLVGTHGVLPEVLTGLTDDSRAVTGGSCFIAVAGAARDGHDFLPVAAERGAALAIVADASRTTLPALVVHDTRRAAAVAASTWYGAPQEALRMLGVTGTNGKTTSVGMLRHLFDAPGARAASIGTLGVLVGSEGTTLPGGSGLTTPGPIELQRVLRALVDAGIRTVAMEASSHSLDQHRVDGIRFSGVLFTNFTRDHLDYHGTMAAYFAAKARLLSLAAPEAPVVVNADDAAWNDLPASAHRRIRFSAGANAAHVYARRTRFTPTGSSFVLHAPESEPQAVRLPLLGDFQVENAVGAAALAWGCGLSPTLVAERLSSLPQVPGRLERLSVSPAVLRDYAHTPEALERALAAVRPFAPGKVIVVFGAGGDRDRGKRPEMGRVAAAGADLAIVTSDNPRTEDPERILDDIVAGMPPSGWERIEDRRAAIARAIALAGPDDLVLLAGKGHETYQIRGTTPHPFDEAEIVAELVHQ